MTELSYKMSDSDIVKADKASIYLGNIFTVEADLKLPSEGKHGSKISWESKYLNALSNDGKVTRPEAGKGNAVVALVATITKGQFTDTREFEVTVLEKESIHTIIAVREYNIETLAGFFPRLPKVAIVEKDDGTFGIAELEWEQINVDCYRKQGDFKVYGTVTGTDLKAAANVKVIVSEADAKAEDDNIPYERVAGPFELGSVTIEDKVFAAGRDRDYQYLLSVNDDQLLYNFRDASGLDTKNAPPAEGWDAPDCNLRGHTTGHYLSAIAQAYASSKDEKFKKKIDYMITELGKCQDAMAASGKFNPGFLSGYSEEQFDKLEELTTYPKIWAPYYTLHKIMAGLVDCYLLAGNILALDICTKLGDWVYNRLSRLTEEKLTKMWALYIAGEFGGINEVMAQLYGLTGKQEYLKAAEYFDNDKLYVPMSENIDTLGGIHSNQHVPQVVGVMEMFRQNKKPYYYKIAKNFWEMVINNHTYNIGGNGEGEMFRAAGKIARYIGDKTAETCSTYNMLKLTRALFFHTPEPRYMDYYERALYNHIIASQDQSAPNGGSTYFMPLCPGSRKEFDSDGNTCCHGTGMENHTKYQDSIYFHSSDNSTLYINLYMASTLDWKEKGFKISQISDYLLDQSTEIIVDGSGKLDIKLRVPYWIEKGFIVKINGEKQSIAPVPGSYVTLSREWNPGDRIEVSTPFTFRIEKTPDDPAVGSIMYGPLAMVGINDTDKYIELALDSEDISKSFTSTSKNLTFTVNGITVIPNYAAFDCPYHAYFKIK
ncbi:MAG: putative glycosylase [Eubacterium sp.]|nr:putative glycosylase [Eubacterium sp.]